MESLGGGTERPSMRTATILLSLLIAKSAAATDVEVPFELDRHFGSILVELKVNGQTATFLVDTGASSSFVSAAMAGVDVKTRSRFRDDAGFEARGVTESVTIELGSAWRATMLVGAIDMAPVTQRYNRRIDGFLGQDVLRQFARVMIDFQRRKLVLSE